MLSKTQFIEHINYIIYQDEKDKEFDTALKKFAPSDFTGYYNEKLHTFLLDLLAAAMSEDEEEQKEIEELISWWLYDCPEAGKHPEHAKIWGGEKGDPDTIEYDVSTSEKLYDYIYITHTKAPSRESVRMSVKAQDSGVKFALKTIQEMRETNKETQNKDWESRDALLRYAQDKIEHEYRFRRGIQADLNLDKPLHIISLLEDEDEKWHTQDI